MEKENVLEKILEKNVEDLTDEEVEMIEERIDELEEEIEYEERKLDVCAYGTSDLMYVMGLREELAELESKIYA